MGFGAILVDHPLFWGHLDTIQKILMWVSWTKIFGPGICKKKTNGGHGSASWPQVVSFSLPKKNTSGLVIVFLSDFEVRWPKTVTHASRNKWDIQEVHGHDWTCHLWSASKLENSIFNWTILFIVVVKTIGHQTYVLDGPIYVGDINENMYTVYCILYKK